MKIQIESDVPITEMEISFLNGVKLITNKTESFFMSISPNAKAVPAELMKIFIGPSHMNDALKAQDKLYNSKEFFK